MARRKKQDSSNQLAMLIAGFLLISAILRMPGFGSFLGVILAFSAIAIWCIGARQRANHLQQWATVSNLYALSPEDFERHVADTYASIGYRTRTTARTGDQGLDVIAERSGEKIGIQCKRTTESVSNSAVQEAFAGKAHYGCSSAIVISLGGFTAPARSLASTTGVRLIDGKEYADIFREATQTPAQNPWKVIPPLKTAFTAICLGFMAMIAFLGSIINAAGH